MILEPSWRLSTGAIIMSYHSHKAVMHELSSGHCHHHHRPLLPPRKGVQDPPVIVIENTFGPPQRQKTICLHRNYFVQICTVYMLHYISQRLKHVINVLSFKTLRNCTPDFSWHLLKFNALVWFHDPKERPVHMVGNVQNDAVFFQ